MANYYGMCRTNYFPVTDVDKFKDIMSKLSGEGEIEFYEHDEDKGKFMFYCDCNLTGYITDPDDDDAYDDALDKMFEELQGILPDGEAIILTEVGNEKMRYLLGIATIITNKEVCSVNLADAAIYKAREVLGNSEYCTQMDY